MKKYIILLFVPILLFACNNEESSIDNVTYSKEKVILSLEEYLSLSYDEGNTILSENEAKDVLVDFLNQNNIRNTRNTQNNQYEISINDLSYLGSQQSTKSSISSKNEETLPIYSATVIEGQDEFEAIISADYRAPLVIAYYSKNEHQNDIDSDYNNQFLIDGSLKLICENLKSHKALADSLSKETIAKVKDGLNIISDEWDFETYKDLIDVNDGNYTKATISQRPNDFSSSFGPLLQTAWSPYLPYNRTMPQGCPNNWMWDDRQVLSSVVVATAQILAFYQPSLTVYGTSINWETLTKKETIVETDYFTVGDPIATRNMVAELMRYIGAREEVSYQCNSSTVYQSKVKNFLSSLGIYMDQRQKLNPAVIKSSIDNLRPVMAYGKTSKNEGHWWLIDGYYTLLGGTSGSNFPNYRIYMHANMGMGTSYQGYYLVATNGSLTFDARFAHFNKDIEIYPNIRR